MKAIVEVNFMESKIITSHLQSKFISINVRHRLISSNHADLIFKINYRQYSFNTEKNLEYIIIQLKKNNFIIHDVQWKRNSRYYYINSFFLQKRMINVNFAKHVGYLPQVE